MREEIRRVGGPAVVLVLAAACGSGRGAAPGPDLVDAVVAPADVPAPGDPDPADVDREDASPGTDVPADAPDATTPDVPTPAELPPADLPAPDDLSPDGAAPDLPPPDLPPADVPPPLPAGCRIGEFQPFFGNLHAHSGNSDGAGTPAEAFAYARDTGGLDFQFITDHLEQLYQIPCLWPNDGWPTCNDQADAANDPGKFLAGCGFEYGTSVGGVTGHNNAYFTDGLFPCLQIYFTDFYKSVVECADCIAQFNHPGDIATQHWGNFQYDAEVDRKMNLYEFNSDPAFDMYFDALDAGWHVSPVYDQDNHGADWGSKNEGRAGFWLADLSRASLHAGMRERRSFATTDRNATITLKTPEGCWMGSILEGVDTLSVAVEVADPDATDAFTTLELWGPKATTLATIDCAGAAVCSATIDVQVTAPTYVFARALQADGHYLVSAPIWAVP